MAGGDARRPPLHGNQLSQAHRGADGFLSDRRQETGDRRQGTGDRRQETGDNAMHSKGVGVLS